MKMELVLSTGDSSRNSSSHCGGSGEMPFRNEDVKEWSRYDRITGMLERARVETGRWTANTKDSQQSYGKMIDSRERNSVDGNLVQKGCRQLEVFQSQGTAGNSFQVVKASQWASSKVNDDTNRGFSFPDFTPNNSYLENEMSSRVRNPFHNFWGFHRNTELDRLSYLCRKFHEEAINNIFSFGTRTPSPLMFDNFDNSSINDDKISITTLSDKRSNSSDDLTSLIQNNDALPALTFNRDSKARRSLQFPVGKRMNAKSEENDKMKNEFRFLRNGFDTINENHNGIDTVDNFVCKEKDMNLEKDNFPVNGDNDKTVKGFRLKDEINDLDDFLRNRKKNNRTVVHLKNEEPTLFPENDFNRCNVNIKVENGITGQEKNAKNTNNNHTNTLLTESYFHPKEDATSTPKPIKKVEFCKTEIHFAPDSGRVNIVETDGKPPPTNKFRRRRRNLSNGLNNNNKNMPLTHFGDTSYEKYIFGGAKVPKDEKKILIINDINDKLNGNDSGSRNVSLSEMIDNNSNSLKNKYLRNEGNKANNKDDQKYKGHTTRVNIMNDEINACAKGKEGLNKQNGSLFGNVSKNESNKNNSKVVSKDSDNNEVHLKVVKTYKPTIAKVESSPRFLRKMMKSKDDSSQKIKEKTKDRCDNKKEKNPLYENIFDAITDTTPIYQNYKLIKPESKSKLTNSKSDKLNDSLHKPSSKVLKNSNQLNKAPKVDSKSKEKASKIKEKTKNLSSLSPGKESERMKSRATPSPSRDTKLIKGKQDVSKKYFFPATKGSEKNEKIESLRSKKPVEVIYDTVVVNLSKPAKVKEPKGPSLLNDLICGSKLKRSPDNKKSTKSGAVTQTANNRRKESTLHKRF